MDRNNSESNIEIADEQEQQQQQQHGSDEQNEVVPSSETSIGGDDDDDDDENELTTTIAKHKQLSVSVDGPSNGTLSAAVENQANNAQESDDGDGIGELKYESDESDTHLVIQSETEQETATASTNNSRTTAKENGGTASMKRKILNKRKSSETSVKTTDFEEEFDSGETVGEKFRGFSLNDINVAKATPLLSKRSKVDAIPETNLSTFIEASKKIVDQALSVAMNETAKKSPVNVPTSTPRTPSEKPAHIITTDPRYRNPFKHGWRRELVFRANIDNKQKLENKGEVYYHSPNGKKLRSKGEIMNELRDLRDQNLHINDFTFAKESIGMPPDLEIVRKAKIQTPSQRSKPVVLPEPTPDVLGKRIPKPKMPKGASPPPPPSSYTANKSRLPSSANKRQIDKDREIVEVIQPKAIKSNSRSGKEPCTINCVLAMGIIPQLQCRKCQFMFHHECVGRDASRPSGNFICEHCIKERNEASQNIQVSQTAVAKEPVQNTSNGNVNLADKQKERSNRKSLTLTTPNKPNPNSLLLCNRTPRDDASGTTSSLNKPQTDPKSPPQSIAIVAGRKYIMVPKSSVPADILNGAAQETKSPSGANPSSSVGAKSATPRIESVVSPSLPVTGNIYASATASVQTLFATEFFGNVSRGYDILFNIFQYLKVQELLRASRVCRMWNHVANNNVLWRTVRMKNSQANDWAGLMTALRRHGTKDLDLRKILIPSTLDWNDFITHICHVPELEVLHLCRCPAEVVTALLETNTNLKSLNALLIQGDSVALPLECNLTGLTELRLKSNSPITIENIQSLKKLTKLRHLSLTSIKITDINQLDVLTTLTALESLEFGDCNTLTSHFAKNILIKLRKLERLRLEKGQERCCTFDIVEAIEKLPKLAQLELVNFDIRPGFDTRLGQCKRLKRILLIPTYISQSAATNNIIMSSIAQLGHTLHAFTWVVTQELIRVTDLYTSDHNSDGPAKKPTEDKIPIIKPVPMMKEATKSISGADTNTQLVEILPLNQVEQIIRTNIPKMKLKIVKVPFSATWRQTMSETHQ